MKRLLISLMFIALITAAAVAVVAQEAPPPAPVVPRPAVSPASGMSYPAPCILTAMRLVHPGWIATLNDRLKLTTEQMAKVNSLLSKAEEDSKPLVQAQRAAAEEFVVVLAKPNATEAEITAAAKKTMDAETALISAKAKTLVEIRSLLTEEQKKVFTEMLEQYTSNWRPRPAARPAGAPVPPAGGAQ